MPALPLLGIQTTLDAFLNRFESLDLICQIRRWLHTQSHKALWVDAMKGSEQFLARTDCSISVCSYSQSPGWAALVSPPALCPCGWGASPCILQLLDSTDLFGFESQFCFVIYRLCDREQVTYCPGPQFPHSSNKVDNITVITTSKAARIPSVQQILSTKALRCLRPSAGY